MSDTVFYIAAAVVIAHFVVGFIFLVRKLSGPLPDDNQEENNKEEQSES